MGNKRIGNLNNRGKKDFYFYNALITIIFVHNFWAYGLQKL